MVSFKSLNKRALIGAWLSLVERYLGVVEVACSNHVAPTSNIKAFSLLGIWQNTKLIQPFLISFF